MSSRSRPTVRGGEVSTPSPLGTPLGLEAGSLEPLPQGQLQKYENKSLPPIPRAHRHSHTSALSKDMTKAFATPETSLYLSTTQRDNLDDIDWARREADISIVLEDQVGRAFPRPAGDDTHEIHSPRPVSFRPAAPIAPPRGHGSNQKIRQLMGIAVLDDPSDPSESTEVSHVSNQDGIAHSQDQDYFDAGASESRPLGPETVINNDGKVYTNTPPPGHVAKPNLSRFDPATPTGSSSPVSPLSPLAPLKRDGSHPHSPAGVSPLTPMRPKRPDENTSKRPQPKSARTRPGPESNDWPQSDFLYGYTRVPLTQELYHETTAQLAARARATGAPARSPPLASSYPGSPVPRNARLASCDEAAWQARANPPDGSSEPVKHGLQPGSPWPGQSPYSPAYGHSYIWQGPGEVEPVSPRPLSSIREATSPRISSFWHRWRPQGPQEPHPGRRLSEFDDLLIMDDTGGAEGENSRISRRRSLIAKVLKRISGGSGNSPTIEAYPTMTPLMTQTQAPHQQHHVKSSSPTSYRSPTSAGTVDGQPGGSRASFFVPAVAKASMSSIAQKTTDLVEQARTAAGILSREERRRENLKGRIRVMADGGRVASSSSPALVPAQPQPQTQSPLVSPLSPDNNDQQSMQQWV
ncbi:hypothetical protein B0T19DRAFT_438102 [Cercophora scortea]|uniref:Uncharacterized protein n=1 Tax=Cercophora scortea TaxID=314031 RepID=A0AAE0J5R2_9PEZI|nr:hypothetical protein B0T19DRAFT_438102 [Cercophora scortea]